MIRALEEGDRATLVNLCKNHIGRHRHVNALGVGERLNADHVDFP
jgi:hypothetical protein